MCGCGGNPATGVALGDGLRDHQVSRLTHILSRSPRSNFEFRTNDVGMKIAFERGSTHQNFYDQTMTFDYRLGLKIALKEIFIIYQTSCQKSLHG